MYSCFFTAENIVPDFNIYDYGIGFHYIEFGDRYMRFPLYLVDGFKAYEGGNYASDLQMAMHKHESPEQLLTEKTNFCSFVYSNAQAASCREGMFTMLSKYKQVSSGGRYKNNVCALVTDELEFQKKHKFVIAFENTAAPGYTTEKIIGAFAAGAVPIYWGNPGIAREFNAGGFINCNDYGLTEKGEPKIIDQIVQEVMRIDKNKEAYLHMLKTPAFTIENDVNRQQQEFEAYLYNIFDQPVEQAYRRNRFYWGERYERKQKVGNSFYWRCRKLIPLRDAIKKIVGK